MEDDDLLEDLWCQTPGSTPWVGQVSGPPEDFGAAREEDRPVRRGSLRAQVCLLDQRLATVRTSTCVSLEPSDRYAEVVGEEGGQCSVPLVSRLGSVLARRDVWTFIESSRKVGQGTSWAWAEPTDMSGRTACISKASPDLVAFIYRPGAEGRRPLSERFKQRIKIRNRRQNRFAKGNHRLAIVDLGSDVPRRLSRQRLIRVQSGKVFFRASDATLAEAQSFHHTCKGEFERPGTNSPRPATLPSEEDRIVRQAGVDPDTEPTSNLALFFLAKITPLDGPL